MGGISSSGLAKKLVQWINKKTNPKNSKVNAQQIHQDWLLMCLYDWVE
jgi:hypothetical protein